MKPRTFKKYERKSKDGRKVNAIAICKALDYEQSGRCIAITFYQPQSDAKLADCLKGQDDPIRTNVYTITEETARRIEAWASQAPGKFIQYTQFQSIYTRKDFVFDD